MDNRKFREVVTDIKKAERDVDSVLEAARLTRHESSSRMTREQKLELIQSCIWSLFALVALAVLPVMVCLLIFSG